MYPSLDQFEASHHAECVRLGQEIALYSPGSNRIERQALGRFPASHECGHTIITWLSRVEDERKGVTADTCEAVEVEEAITALIHRSSFIVLATIPLVVSSRASKARSTYTLCFMLLVYLVY